AAEADHREDNGSDEDRRQNGDPELLVHPCNVRLLTQCVKQPAAAHDAKMPAMDELARRVGLRLEGTPPSKQVAGGAFPRPAGAPTVAQGDARPPLGEHLLGNAQRVPPGPLPAERPHEAWARPAETGLRATWLGHSTVLLELDRHRVLTDPVFAERASPF